jgi:hypothetical protein
MARTHLAMLHDTPLPQCRLIEWIASSMYNVTQSVLFRQHEHRVEEAFHRFRRLDESRTANEACRSVRDGGRASNTQFVRFIKKQNQDLLRGWGFFLLGVTVFIWLESRILQE